MTNNDVRSKARTKPLAIALAASMLLVGAGTASAAPAGRAGAGPAPSLTAAVPAAPVESEPLTNTAHLDFLMETVPLAPVAGHTTYKLNEMPSAQAPWTYADKKEDGSYGRVGGGDLDPATGIDPGRVQRRRHRTRRGGLPAALAADRRYASKERAFQTLRSLTFLQTTEGPNAGNVVLWQQEDGSLTPSAKPVELPDPSDSAESYWLARTVWALGEGYSAFEDEDPEFAAFLEERLHLAWPR